MRKKYYNKKKKANKISDGEILVIGIFGIIALYVTIEFIIKHKTIIEIILGTIIVIIVGIMLYNMDKKEKRMSVRKETMAEVQERLYIKRKREAEREYIKEVAYKNRATCTRAEEKETIQKSQKTIIQKAEEEIARRAAENVKVEKSIKQKSRWKLGREYEEQIGKYYEDLDYKVLYNGIEKGRKDGGIDLIATDCNEILLIQCKNWQRRTIKQRDLKEFLFNCIDYISKNNIKDTYAIKKIFITSNQTVDYGVKRFLKEHQGEIEYEIMPYKNR